MNQAIKTKRLQLIIGGALLFGVVMLVLLTMSRFDSPKVKSFAKKGNTTELNFTTANSKIDPQEVWRSKMEDNQEKVAKSLKALAETLDNYKKEAEAKQDELKDTIENLTHSNENNNSLPNDNMVNSIAAPSGKIARLTIHLENNKEKALTTVDNTIPAGTFARAVLLSGVDATTAINIKADPKPMLLRIIDFGNMPRKFTTDLIDCHCTAAAWGELSSERVHTRIEKLSCIERATGEILEIEAKGYLTGSDGREGIRGTVVSKDGQFLTKSLWGGVFAGIGGVLSPANRQAQAGPFLSIGTQAPKASVSDMFKTGFGESTNTSLNKLSEYYIQRAEQIQPVIQVAAGQEVDVIFTEGVAIDQSLISKQKAITNDVFRKKTAEQQEEHK